MVTISLRSGNRVQAENQSPTYGLFQWPIECAFRWSKQAAYLRIVDTGFRLVRFPALLSCCGRLRRKLKQQYIVGIIEAGVSSCPSLCCAILLSGVK